MRTEQYINALPHKRIAEHKPKDVISHLKKLGRIGSITNWQFRQSVDAIQNLFATLEAFNRGQTTVSSPYCLIANISQIPHLPP